MVQLAVTGNMGCGKTTVCEMLISWTSPSIFLIPAEEFMNQDLSLIQQIQKRFGKESIAVVCLTENGYLNEFLRIPKR